MARKHVLTLRESELSEHGFSLRNRVRKDSPSGRVICSDRAKVRHDRQLHIEKKMIFVKAKNHCEMQISGMAVPRTGTF